MIKKDLFGKTSSGENVYIFTISEGKYQLQVINLGAVIVSLSVPDRNGLPTDVVLGFDNVASYEGKCDCIGAVIGRFCNRIRKGRFTLNGKMYQIPINDGNNALHGGLKGFDKKLWSYRQENNGVAFTYVSPDGEEGFPGNFTCQVTYKLTSDGVLHIDYSAFTDADTIWNITNHSYFNLEGASAGSSVFNHVFSINSNYFAEPDEECLPTGQILKVDGTELDFRNETVLSSKMENLGVYTSAFNGFDNTYILNKTSNGSFDKAATAYSPKTGILMECRTTMPALQFYTGNNLSVQNPGKQGKLYKKYSGFCFETQNIPDSPNFPHFNNVILHPGEVLSTSTEYRFSVK